MRLQAVDLHVAYIQGKDLHIVDTFSKVYLQEQTEQLLGGIRSSPSHLR